MCSPLALMVCACQMRTQETNITRTNRLEVKMMQRSVQGKLEKGNSVLSIPLVMTSFPLLADSQTEAIVGVRTRNIPFCVALRISISGPLRVWLITCYLFSFRFRNAT